MEEMQYKLRDPLQKGDELLDFVFGLQYDDLSQELVEKTKRTILDDISAACAGRRTLEKKGRLFERTFPNGEEASIFGTNQKTDVQSAAFINACYMQYHDFTDGFDCSGVYSSSFHPGRVIIPAAMAMAEKMGASGKDLIPAIVAAYEVAARIRNPKYIGMSIADAMAVAAATSKIAGATREQIKNAMSIAAYFCPVHNLGMGENAGNIYDVTCIGIGELARAGVVSTVMALNGMTGAPFNDDPNYTRRYRVHGMGEDYYIMHTYFKPWPVCRKTHGAIACAIRFRNEYHIRPQDIKEVIIYQQNAAMYVDNPVTKNFDYLHRQFSLQYETACAFFDGTIEFDRLTSDEVAPDIFDFAQRIRVVGDDSLDGCCETKPNHAAMDIILKDGTVRSLYEPYPLGAGPNPMTKEQSIAKLAYAAENLYSEKEQENLVAYIDNIENKDSVDISIKSLIGR